MIIALINQKGGVGKTTVTLNLGAALAEAGKRVVLLDLDPQRDLSAYAKGVPAVLFEEATPENLPELLKREADFFLLDCPPALGAQSAAALKVAHVALVPLQTEFLALRGLKRMQETTEAARSPQLGNNRKLKLKILLTLTDTRDPAPAAIIEDVRGRFPGKRADAEASLSVIGTRVSLSKASVHRLLALLELPSDVQDRFEKSNLNEKRGRALVLLQGREEESALLSRIESEELSGNRALFLAEDILSPKTLLGEGSVSNGTKSGTEETSEGVQAG